MNQLKTPQNDDRELLDLLQSQDKQTPAEEWSAMLNDIRTLDDASPSQGFEDAVRHRWQAELAAAERPAQTTAHPWRLPRLAWPLMAAAAVIAFVLLWTGSAPTGTGGGSPSAGVAWGDVVRAMQNVEQFHVLAFDDDPRAADESRPSIVRFDLFHQHPDRWRAQGFGHVAFAKTGEKQRIWSAEKRAWLGPKDRDPDILPTDFIDRHAKLGPLGAILATFFGGEVPPSAPVKSDEVVTAQGIDVFDYAKDASKQWARIWVLRESKLPLKMHLYQPESDEFLLVTFDYSDPQPAAFFDAEAFAAAAVKIEDEEAMFRDRRVYGIGSKPVAGTQPRGADQIFDVKGYKAPTVRRVASNDAGDVMIVTDDLDNTTPAGGQPHFEGFRKLTDTWGNTLIPAGIGRSGNERAWLYMPLPPMKRTNSPRKVNATYVIEPVHGEPQQPLATQTLDVAAPAENSIPKHVTKQKNSWYRNHLQHNGSLEQQLEEVRRRLATDPTDADTLTWKYRLLRTHGRADAAPAFFEQHLRDRALADPTVLDECSTEMSQYLLHLAGSGRMDEMRSAVGRINQMIEEVSASPALREQWKHSSLLDKEHYPLYRARKMIEWRETYKDGPSVLVTQSSKDGYVFIEFEIPAPPDGWRQTGWDGSAPMGWFWNVSAADGGWTMHMRSVNLEKRRLGLVFRGEGQKLSLGGEAVLLSDNFHVRKEKNDFKVKWQRTIEVPKPTVDDMPALLNRDMGKEASWYPAPGPLQASGTATPNAIQQALDEGDKLRAAGQFEEASKKYEQVLAAPGEQWPAHYRQASGLDPNLLEGRRRGVRIARAECLARLKCFDEARAEAAQIRAALPESPRDFNDPLHAMITADAMAADLEVVKGLLASGDAPAAAAELKRIGANRPDYEDFVQGTVMVPRGPASFGWNPRGFEVGAWRKFDTVWWDVHDALQKKSS